MSHPYEHLADLVDGTLDEDALAGVRAHLDVCGTCRRDVARATAGRAAARSLPREQAPADLEERILREAGGRDRAVPGWYRWAGAAAAAALVIGLAFALPDVGDDRGGGRRAEDAATAPTQEGVAAGGGSAEDVDVSVQDRDYDEQALRELASGASDGGGDGALDAPAATAAELARASADRAIGCVDQAFEGAPTGRLVRLIDARFRGRDAYIALYLEGPGADQPPDTAAVWVAAENDCTPLTFASARI
ncbi:MAG TPA: zf-HC2 domain-containing protein [Actinomycetota bacterium]|nr:zf-HC2 domain-containing protein [Actinomycetota bacterium]